MNEDEKLKLNNIYKATRIEAKSVITSAKTATLECQSRRKKRERDCIGS